MNLLAEKRGICMLYGLLKEEGFSKAWVCLKFIYLGLNNFLHFRLVMSLWLISCQYFPHVQVGVFHGVHRAALLLLATIDFLEFGVGNPQTLLN